jgi:Spy/CpxP family protein refolding chaperone
MSLDTLGVSPEQRAAVGKIRAELRAELESARVADWRLVATLADGLSASTFDSTKIDAAVAQVTQAVGAAHDASLETLNELHAALTPPQRAALVDKVEAHWAVWKQANADETGTVTDPSDSHLARLARELELTPEQTTEIRRDLAHGKTAARLDEDEVAAHLRTFSDAFRAETFDAKAIVAEDVGDGSRPPNQEESRERLPTPEGTAIGDDDGHVVGSARGERRGDESLRRVRDVAGDLEDRGDDVIVNGPMETVGAKQDAVALAQIDLRDDRLDATVGAERLQQDVAIGEPLDVLGLQRARLDHLRGDRLILREQLQLAVAQEVGARISDLGDREMVGSEHRGRARRAHALVFGVTVRLGDDGAVRALDGALQGGARNVHDRGPGPLDLLLDRRGGHARGDVARGPSPHSVADDEENARAAHRYVRPNAGTAQLARAEIGDDEGVLVVGALGADVGATAHGQEPMRSFDGGRVNRLHHPDIVRTIGACARPPSSSRRRRPPRK